MHDVTESYTNMEPINTDELFIGMLGWVTMENTCFF